MPCLLSSCPFASVILGRLLLPGACLPSLVCSHLLPMPGWFFALLFLQLISLLGLFRQSYYQIRLTTTHRYFLVCFLSFFKDFFILSKSHKDGDGGGKLIHPLVHCPMATIVRAGPGTSQEPGTLFWLAGACALGSSSATFSGILISGGLNWKQNCDPGCQHCRCAG